MSKAVITANSIVVASENQVSTELGNEAVILGAEQGQYFGLNEVGARIWGLVREPVSVAQLCATLLDEYEVDAEQCQRDVIELLGDMHEKGLIDVRAEVGSP